MGREGEGGREEGGLSLLKIYGGHIIPGATYKGVLASRTSAALNLLKEVLSRYSLAQEDPEGFRLCEALGRRGDGAGGGGEWREECLREVGDDERPLLLMEMWRPRQGLERRLEIWRKEALEARRREEGADGVTEGINAQARHLLLTRAGVRVPGPAASAEGGSLRRSISEANINGGRRWRRQQVKSLFLVDTSGQRLDDGDPPLEGEGGSSQLKGPVASLLRPPATSPYFILLQGYDQRQDILVHLIQGKVHTFGNANQPVENSAPDTSIIAPDILPLHFRIRRANREGRDPSAYVRPYPGALLTKNGSPVQGETCIISGDLLGLGRHVLLMFRDPGKYSARPDWFPTPPEGQQGNPSPFSCLLCGRGPQESQEAFRAYLESKELVLKFRGQDQAETTAILEEAVRGGGCPGDGEKETEASGLVPAYLLSICIQHVSESLGPWLVPPFLLKVAKVVKKAAWENIKDVGTKEEERGSQDYPTPQRSEVDTLTADLRPLIYWMANSIELLNFVQKTAMEVEEEVEDDFLHDRAASAEPDPADESLVLLDEVLVCMFQRCVYHLTKTLHSALPSLLDTNPFAAGVGEGEEEGGGGEGEGDLPRFPAGVARVVDIFRAALDLGRASQLHPDLMSQMFGYAFFFCDSSLLNALMERGERSPFYQWTRAVQIRTNLDLVLDWLQEVALGDIAALYFRKFSAAVNLLCIPKTNLLKMSWNNIHKGHSAINTAQVWHLLRNYHLGKNQSHPTGWNPPEDTERLQRGDIYESFTDHPPLILPSQGFSLSLAPSAASVPSLWSECLHRRLCSLRLSVWEREREKLPANQRPGL